MKILRYPCIWHPRDVSKPTHPVRTDKGFDQVDPSMFQYVSGPCAIIPLNDSEYPPEAALMKYLQPMMLLLGGIPNFISVKKYSENCSFAYPNLCIGLDIAVLLNITQLLKSTTNFPDSS